MKGNCIASLSFFEHVWCSSTDCVQHLGNLFYYLCVPLPLAVMDGDPIIFKAKNVALGTSQSLLGQRIYFSSFVPACVPSVVEISSVVISLTLSPPRPSYPNMKCKLSHLRRPLCRPVSSELAVVLASSLAILLKGNEALSDLY